MVTEIPTLDAGLIGSFLTAPDTAVMNSNNSRAVEVPLHLVSVPTVTFVGPQASAQPWVRGVQRQGAQLPAGAMPPNVVQLPPGGMPPNVVQLLPGGMPPNVIQLVPGGQPQSVVQLLPGGQPQTVIQLPPAGMATNVVQLPPGGLLLNVAQLPRGGQPPNVQLPPGVVPMVVGQLPADGQELPLLLLLPGGMKPGMPPPNAPAQHRQHPQRAGTLQPQQPMGLRPGARLHGKRPRSAGSCPMQTPSRPLKKVRREPPRQHQVITVRCSLRTRRAQEGQPLGDAVVQTKDQGNSAPTNVSPKPTTAPLTCSTAAPGSGGEFGGCRVGCRLSAPGGCGKAGIATMGMFLLFQQRLQALTSRRTSRIS